MKEKIQELLRETERQHAIRLLFACESGSRGWGFPSADSDYDIRFIYLREREAYLSVGEIPDQLGDPPGEWDMHGWDLRKVLRLLLKSNCTPFEWIQSPVVYQADDLFVDAFRRLIPGYFSPRCQVRHYLGIVFTQLGELKEDTIRVKKLCYVLRSLLSAEWILARNTFAPMEMEPLMVLLPADLREETRALIATKAKGTEGDTINLSPRMKQYITMHLAEAERRAAGLPVYRFAREDLDAFFRAFV